VTVVTQVIAAAAPGDAVTDQALAWQRLLEGWGHRGRIVAEHVDPALAGRVRRLDAGGAELLGAGPVVLHYSVWSATIDAALRAPGPLAVCYHNVTPGDLLREANPELAAACDRAREWLPRLRGRVRALIADSAFNASELAPLGLTAEVVPLLLDAAPRPEPPRPARPSGATVLSVGRIAPNKRIEDVIGAFHLYRGHRDPAARLVLVGSDAGFERYRIGLDRLLARLGTRGVTFAGRVSDAERDRRYADADAYLCLSVHEGFCAPLVEAMAHAVPVVARRAGAVPETLGGAGVVIDGGLALAAEALHEVVSSESTRAALRAAGRARLEQLAPAVVAERLHAALAPVLDAR
jgi:L-malate glycosyltransferase